MKLCQHGLTISEVPKAIFEYCEIHRELIQDWHSERFLYPNGTPAEVTYRVNQINGVWCVEHLVLTIDQIRATEIYLAEKHNIKL